MKTVLVKNEPKDIMLVTPGELFVNAGKSYKATSSAYEKGGEIYIDVETDDNAFWKMANQNSIASFIGARNLMIQGELIAPNIQGNFEGVSQPQLHVYNMFDIEKQEWIAPDETWRMMPRGGMPMVFHVPVLHEAITLREMFPDATRETIVQELLDYAEGPSALGGKYREGVVFKRTDGKFSFKAISTSYLLKEKE